MAKLKIGLFIDTWFPMIDGVINVVNNYAEELCKVADVTVFTIGSKKQDTKLYPFKVVRAGSMVVPFLDYEVPIITPKFQKYLKEADLDIVHIHSPFSIGKAGVEYAKKNKIPVVATLHSQYYKDFYRYTKSRWLSLNLLKTIVKVFNDCDKVYAVNSKVAEVGEEYGILPKPSVHNNGTHFKYVENIKPAYEFFERKYGIKQDEIVLLFVGRINKIKNLEFLIDSLAELANMGQKFRMLFVGSGGDKDELQTYAKKLGLKNQVLFLGRVDDEELVHAYVRSKLFVFPSLYDASSLVQIEAASQKTPTLFIRGAVTSATVTENINGFMAENDPVLYAEKIKQILQDEQEYIRVSENAYNDLYVTWKKTVARMYQRYLAVIDKHNEDMAIAENTDKAEQERKLQEKTQKVQARQQKILAEKERKATAKLKKQKEKHLGIKKSSSMKSQKSRVDKIRKKDIIKK